MRETVVQPLGIITQPNPYGQFPAGAMSQAQNVVMRSPGVLDQAPGLNTAQSVGASGDTIHDVIPIDGGAAITRTRTGGGAWTVRRNADAYLPPSGVGAVSYSQTGFCASVRSNGRVFLNSEAHGVLVIDDPAANPGGTARLREAGLPQGALVGVGHTAPNPLALKQFDVVGYACLYRRTYADSYEIVGAPSPIFVFFAVFATNPSVHILTRSTMYLQEGDIVEVYRTNIISNGTSATDPGTDLKLIIEHTITASDLATGSITLIDKTQPGPLGFTAGLPIYTGPNQRGSFGAHFAPPTAKCMAMFKNHMFVANVTDKAKLKFTIPAGLANSSFTGFTTAAWRTFGVGCRELTGNSAVGSPTITGVSAADLVGLKPGQLYGGVYFPTTARVQSVGVTSVTLTLNATGVGTVHSFHDVLELNGYSNRLYDSPRSFLNDFQSNTTGEFILTTTENLVSDQDPANGVRNVEYTIQLQRWGDGSPTQNALTVRATNGANYDPPLPEWTSPDIVIGPKSYRNAYRWSNDNQPEHQPVTNEQFCGAEDVIALASTRDALWFFATDGLWRLSGAGGDWRLDIVDTTLRLCSPRAACVLRESVYAYTNVGLVRITDAGVERLSSQLVSDSLLPEVEYTETAGIIVSFNEPTDEIVVRTGSTLVVVYNVRTGAFTTISVPNLTAMAYARYPAVGTPALVFAQNLGGIAPTYAPWNGGPSTAQAVSVRFQPLYASDPFALKHWTEATYVFKGSSNVFIRPSWNGVANASSIFALFNGQFAGLTEARARTGVPRRVAIGHSISPGYTQSAGSPTQALIGLSLRFRLIGEQDVRRGSS